MTSPTNDDSPNISEHPQGGRLQRMRYVLSSAVFSIPLSLGILALCYFARIPAVDGPADMSWRLAFAAQWTFVAMLPYLAVFFTILQRRLVEGAHDPRARSESPRLEVHCRVMQNTLEQLVWLAVGLWSLASLLAPGELHLIPLLASGFVVARLLYWWGYLQPGTLGRRIGVQITLTVNGGLAILVGTLLATRGFLGL